MRIIKGGFYAIGGDSQQYATCQNIGKDEQGRDYVIFQRMYYDKRKAYKVNPETMPLEGFMQIIDTSQILLIH